MEFAHDLLPAADDMALGSPPSEFHLLDLPLGLGRIGLAAGSTDRTMAECSPCHVGGSECCGAPVTGAFIERRAAVSIPRLAKCVVLLLGASTFLLGAHGMILALGHNEGPCHGSYTMRDDDGDPNTPPILTSGMTCGGDCPPPTPFCGGTIVQRPSGVFYAYCSCCVNPQSPGPEPEDCHMISYYVLLPGGVLVEVGTPQCTGPCLPPRPPVCRVQHDEPNEYGAMIYWCDCVNP